MSGRVLVCPECGWEGMEADCPVSEVWAGRGKPGPRMARRCPSCGGPLKGPGVVKVDSAEMG